MKAEGIVYKICSGADESQQPLLAERNGKQSLWDGPLSTARLLLAQLPSYCLFQTLICEAGDISGWRGLTNSVGQQGTVFHRDQ